MSQNSMAKLSLRNAEAWAVAAGGLGGAVGGEASDLLRFAPHYFCLRAACQLVPISRFRVLGEAIDEFIFSRST